jgi:HK97 family phage major capsid protein
VKTLKELQEQVKKFLTEARDLCDLVDKETRDFTEDERTKVAGLLEDARKTKTEIQKLQSDEAMRKQIFDLGADLETVGTPGDGKGQPRARSMTLGQQFTENPAWKAWLKQVAPNGLIPESYKGLNSPSIEVKDLGLFPRRKELITGLADDSAGAFVVADDTGIYEPIGRYQPQLRNLINVRTTTSDTVEFVRQIKQVSEAAPTPESNVKYPTGYPGEIDGKKPQGEVHWERVHETVKTIAVYVGATKRALADVGQLRGLIDQELRDDLVDELENQLFNGNGVGENFTGIANQPGTLVQAFNTNALITARQAITTLLVAGRQIPTAFVFHPTDWEAIDLLRDLNGNFLRGNPFGAGPNTLWGVPVVQSFHTAQGAGWLANWRKAVLWDREQSTISVTDSHEDWFIRNMIAILAELRAAFGLIRPQAFVQVLMV